MIRPKYMLLLFCGTITMIAQEKINPDMRALEATDSTTTTEQETKTKSDRPLPKFDLPEFVITGVAATDLPKFDKVPASDDAGEPVLNLSQQSFARDNETIELGVSSRDVFAQTLPLGSTGIAQLSTGTFFSTQADVRSAYILPDMRFVFGGNYRLSKGFADHTDRSGGGIDGTVHTSIEPAIPVLRHANVDGGLGYQTDTYHFYGSDNPDRSRTVSLFRLGGEISNDVDPEHFVTTHLNFSSLSLNDSLSNTENRIQFGAASVLRAWDIPIDTRAEISLASHGVSVIDFSGKANELKFSDMFVQAALHITWAKGTGQNILRLKPQVFFEYPLDNIYRLFASYAPEVVPMSLSTFVDVNRYVAGSTAVQNQDITHAAELGAEALWTDAFRGRAAIRLQSISDYGVFIDSLPRGVWTMQYGGRATIFSFVIETFATLTRNDYFSSSLELQSLHHEVYGSHIPYLPSLEFSGYYEHEFTRQISGLLTVRCVGKRDADVNGNNPLPAYILVNVQGKYSVLQWLDVTLQIKNMTNKKYDVWRGYQEFPFMLLAGCDVQW